MGVHRDNVEKTLISEIHHFSSPLLKNPYTFFFRCVKKNSLHFVITPPHQSKSEDFKQIGEKIG